MVFTGNMLMKTIAALGSDAKLTNDLAMHIALGLFSLVFVVLPITLYTIVRPPKEKKVKE